MDRQHAQDQNDESRCFVPHSVVFSLVALLTLVRYASTPPKGHDDLPACVGALQDARPRWTVPSGDGDLTIVKKRLQF